MALPTSTDGSFSGQANTQNPQTAGQPATGAARTGSVQPGTATSLLTSQQGIPLYSTALPTVSLNSSTPAAVTTATTTPAQPKHHVNPVLLGFPIVLVLVAVVLFWTAKRSVKSTTE